MRGEITLKILEAISDFGGGAIDAFKVLMSSGYGASYGKLQYEVSKSQRERSRRNFEHEEKIRLRVNYNKLIYKLKQDGLIEENKENGKKLFSLTSKGGRVLSLLRGKKREDLPQTPYPRESGEKLIIVAFDIPEKQAKRRWWLRSVLKDMGFQMLQKSLMMPRVLGTLESFQKLNR